MNYQMMFIEKTITIFSWECECKTHMRLQHITSCPQQSLLMQDVAARLELKHNWNWEFCTHFMVVSMVVLLGQPQRRKRSKPRLFTTLLTVIFCRELVKVYWPGLGLSFEGSQKKRWLDHWTVLRPCLITRFRWPNGLNSLFKTLSCPVSKF